MSVDKKIVLKINKLLLDYFGVPKRDEQLPDPVDLLIATILSQNTNDNNSYKAYQNLKARFPDWHGVVKAPISEIEKEIRPAGLTKQKAAAIKGFLEGLLRERGKIELELEGKTNFEIIDNLTSYKGIGVKTASCVLLFALDRDVCPVDTHVHRTLNRIGVVNEKTPDKTFLTLNENFPEGIAHSFHTNLIKLGRAICKPTSPICSECPLNKICKWDKKNDSGFDNKVNIREFMLLDNVSQKK